MNWVVEQAKAIASAIKEFLSVVEKVQEMSGGRIRGQIVFWAIFLIIIGLAIWPVYLNMERIADKIDSASWFANLLMAIVASLIAFGGMLTLASIVGLLIGMPIRIGLSSPTTKRIDDTFTRLLPLLERMNDEAVDKTATEKLLTEARRLHTDWSKSRINRFVRWLAREPKRKSKEAKRE